MAIGFLEWYEDDDSSLSYRAPLILIPVQLERFKLDPKTHCYKFMLSYTEEDIETNLSLSEKLSRDFDLKLPELREDVLPEEYFIEVSNLIGSYRRWRIVREMVVGMFSFAKILLYKDLDSDNWPDEYKIAEHEKIREILRTKETEQGTDCIIYEEEHNLDEDEHASRLPVILDADSSQMSAIVDALRGRDLVIEGPPGTGKSQTIANFVATALHEGKSVLFIAEKKAALEVVRRRLDNCGLGDFCLELHSTKTQKGKLHIDIRKRIEKRYHEPTELQYILGDLLRERDNLRSYVNIINKEAGPNGEKIYDILWKTERWLSEIKDQNLFFGIDNALNLTRNDINDRLNPLKDFVHLYCELPVAAMKAWHGLKPTKLMPGDEQELKTLLHGLTLKSEELASYFTLIKSTHFFPMGKHLISELLKIATIKGEALTQLPAAFEQNIASKLINGASLKLVEQLWEKVDEYKCLFAKALEFINNTEKVSVEDSTILQQAAEDILALGFGNTTLQELTVLLNEIEKVLASLHTIKKHADTARDILISDVQDFNALRQLLIIVDTINSAPEDIDLFAHAAHVSPYAAELCKNASEEVSEIKNGIDENKSFFNITRLPKSIQLKQLAGELKKISGTFFAFLSPRLRRLRQVIREFVVEPKNVKHAMIIQKLEEIAGLLEKAESSLTNMEYVHVLGPLFKGVETDWPRLEKHISWTQSLRQSIGSQVLAENVICNLKHCRDLSSDLSQKIRQSFEYVEQMLPKLLNNSESNMPLDDIIKSLSGIKDKIGSALNVIEFRVHDSSFNAIKIKISADAFLKANALRISIEDDNRYFDLLGQHFKGIDTDITMIHSIAAWVSSLQNSADMPQEIIEWLLRSDTSDRLAALIACVEKAGEYLSVYTATNTALQETGNYKSSSLFSEEFWGYTPDKCSLERIVEKGHECIQCFDYLLLWSDYCRLLDTAITLGLGKIIENVENEKILPESALAHCNYGIYGSMSKEIIRSHPELSSFTRANYENSRNRFIELDKQVINLSRQQIASKISKRPVPAGRGSGTVREWTNFALIRNELNKRKRHIPLRQLIKRSVQALQALKPCFMMSPLSVSQYLTPGEIKFDFVIMDEASQIKPEDALGGIARGSRLLIVGDSKQLPPTIFFEHNIESSEDDDDTNIAEDTESILDICRTTYRSRRLRWHYRSEHESLIAFSNRQFYDDNLIVFPSPYRADTSLGIRCHYIENAIYSKGKNMTEAQVVVHAIIAHFKACPNVSLGVATFNREQRDLIEDLLDKKRKQDSWLDNIIKESEEQEEPFFIKNLENVQGDERDVIFISFTYGPDADTRKVYQRFGPIGGEAGWRRLNVIFTRAKKRLEGFSSMLPTDLIITDNTPRGVRVLKEFLDYAFNGRFHEYGQISQEEPQSDFEFSVARVLNNHGYKTAFQVGVAGFFIDVGVLHPVRENDFVIGIECDGATYHTGKSVRDRDRLRQEILERKGWQIYRIWSTDWFKNREKEIERLLTTLRALALKESYTDKSTPEILKDIYQTAATPTSAKVDAQITAKSLVKAKTDVDLRETLLHFRRMNIEPTFPDQTKGILRDELLEYFVKNKPTTKEEFRNKIPLKLRENTDGNQTQFFDDIFEIIEEFL